MNVGSRLKSSPRGIAVGFVLGLLIEIPALLVAVFSGGAGHGDYVAARALFPASMLLTLPYGSIGTVSITVGLLQFPIYGALLGWSVERKNYLAAVVLALAHVIAALVCFAGTLPNFS